MKLSEENKMTLLVSLHQLIEISANSTAQHIEHGRINQLINYPPNGGLTNDELREIEKLKNNPILKSALRKVIASSISDTLFELFNIIDGTGDPGTEVGEWSEVMLVDFEEENEVDSMLHDDFFGTYWNWKEKRNNSNWKLDLTDE